MTIPLDKVLLLFALLATSSPSWTCGQNYDGIYAELDEDEVYWSRFVLDVDSLPTEPPPIPAPTPSPSLAATPPPSPAPTPNPTNPPSPLPTNLPSAAPTVPGECLVNVEVGCFSQDGIPCGDLDASNGGCIIPVVYTYAITNVGTDQMDITMLERTRNGQTFDLTDQVIDRNPLFPGDSALTSESDELNVCVSGTYVTTVRGEADPANIGPSCFDEDEISFEITPTPTQNPSPNPTEVQPPTAPPTSLPTQPPTQPPTAPPTAHPTNPPPTQPPTQPPTNPPTIPPPTPFPLSPAPSLVNECLVNVEVDCFSEDGTECEDLEAPSGICSVGDEISVLIFRLTDCTCKESLNGQDESFICSETNVPIPDEGSSVTVACSDVDGNIIYQETASIGGSISVQDSTSDTLPDVLVCVVTNANGSELQTLTINTSGEVELNLSDKYGLLEVEGCDVEGMPAQKCIVPVVYTYTLANVGTNQMDIMLLERIRNGDTVDLTEQVTDRNPLFPGDTATAMETEELNLCVDGLYVTTVRGEAEPPDGVPCLDEAEISFEIFVNCRVDIDIVCESVTGVDCTELEEADGDCSEGSDIVTLGFRYVDCICADGVDSQGDISTCEDLNGGLTGDTVIISCKDIDGNAVGTPQTVEINSLFLVERPNGLPSSLTCTLEGSDGTPLQEVSLDPSGQTKLNLKDKFGGLQLESCSDDSGTELDCLNKVTYTFNIKNIGSGQMNVSKLEIEREETGVVVDLTDQIEDPELERGECTLVDYTEFLDLCEPFIHTTTATTEASSTATAEAGTEICQDSEIYQFQIDVACKMSLDLGCTIAGTTTDCSDLEGEQNVECICEECPSQILFRYNGANLPETVNIAILGDGSEVVSEIVTIGDDIVVDLSGDCLPDEMVITFSDSDTGEEFQTVTVTTACNGEIALLDSFGGVDFIGYTCQENPEDAHNCFIPVDYSFVTENVGSVDLTIVELDVALNGDTTNLIQDQDPADLMLAPGESFETNAVVEIELCTSTMYSAISSVVATSPASAPECQALDFFNFEITTGTPFPSPAPSAPPSPAPSAAPSSPPSPGPSPPPIPLPTGFPTVSPTQPPTMLPTQPSTALPTSPPTSPPTALSTPQPTLTPATPEPGPTSSVPTMVSSPEPTIPAPSSQPTDGCNLELSTDCLPPDDIPGAMSCDTIPPFIVECTERPSEMTFLYNGGNCDLSFNIQPSTLFECFDFDGGPPTEDGAVSYITAFELGADFEFGGDGVYFAGFATVGEEFTMFAGDEFAANMNITIYDPKNFTDPMEIVQTDNMIQTIKYHSSCSNNLFLKDRFGSVQLVIFINEEQGVVTCFQNVTLTFDIAVPVAIEGDCVVLSALQVVTNIVDEDGDPQVIDLTEEVEGVEVAPTMPHSVNVTLTIDLTQRQRYTAFSTVIGQTKDGSVRCFGANVLEFTAGNPLPPIFPTLAPSSAPTRSPFPTPDPETTACMLDSRVTCTRGSNGGSCNNIASPAGVTCDGSNAQQLQFIYIPSELCNGNNTQDRFSCNDLNADISPRPNTVFVTVEKGEVVFFEDVITAGQIFAVDLTDEPNDVEIAISLPAFDGNGNAVGPDPNGVLQESILSTRCRPEDGLTILDTFGNLQLVGFRNQEMGSQQIFESLEIEYTVTNEGVLDAQLTSAARMNDFVSGDFLLPGEIIPMPPREVETFSDRLLLDLTTVAGKDFLFSFLAQGEGTVSGVECAAPAETTISIM